jgi:hypothetical protein
MRDAGIASLPIEVVNDVATIRRNRRESLPNNPQSASRSRKRYSSPVTFLPWARFSNAVRFGSRFPTGSGSLVFRDLGMARLVIDADHSVCSGDGADRVRGHMIPARLAGKRRKSDDASFRSTLCATEVLARLRRNEASFDRAVIDGADSLPVSQCLFEASSPGEINGGCELGRTACFDMLWPSPQQR